MAINLKDTVQIIRGKKTDIAARTGANGELNWADDTYELYIHDGKTRGGHLIGKASGTAGVVGGAGIAVSTSDGISTVSVKRDPSNVLYATTDGAGVRIGTSGALQITAQNALDLRVAEGGGIIVDSSGVKIDSAVLSSVFRYAGQVNSVDDLPSDAQPGDVYDVKDSGANYVWSGTSWDNLGGIMSVDAAPTQGSTNPVASGGVYDAIQDAKLNGDGTTVSVVDNTITAKDIAIDGDVSDLASARGQIGNVVALVNPDFHTIIKSGMFWVSGHNQINAPNDSSLNCFLISYANADSSYVMHIYMRTLNSNACYLETYHASNGWQPWRRVILDDNIGDGITVNNGIISVPEYEGATADTAATSGLVPPAAAGEQDKVLRGDGEWGEYLPTAGGNMTGKISSNANTVLEHTDSNVSIADTSRPADVNELLVVSLDKDGKRGGGVEVSYAEEGYREIHFTMRNRADTGWIALGLRENVDGSSVGRSPNPNDDSDTNDIATTAWVRDRIAEIDFPSEVTLSDSVTSTSSTTAASSMAVKTAYDKAVSATTAATTVMTGATASAAGKAGNVPAPAKGSQGRPLRGDGTWATSLACNITGLAAKATADAGGNTITTTYATKSEVSALQSAMEEDLNTVKEDVDNIPVVSSPDYSSGIALAQPGATEQTYTAPADGYIVYSILGFNNVFAKIYINNILVVNSGTTANTTYWPSTGQLRVSKNDVIKYSCNGERPENFMTFYPCKGA